MWILLLLPLISETEKEACERLAPAYAADVEVTLPDGTRCDLLSDDTAWEIDWAPKWQQAVGQSLLYAIWSERQPGIILLTRGDEDKLHVLRCKLVCERANITLRIEKTDRPVPLHTE